MGNAIVFFQREASFKGKLKIQGRREKGEGRRERNENRNRLKRID